MKHSLIITAGGIGKRMGDKIPKQFLYLNDKPILLHTLELFHAFNPLFEIIITLPSDWISHWENLIKTHQTKIPHKVVNGGTERFHSIKNAIKKSTGKVVWIHDGVRPMVSNETLNRLLIEINDFDAVIPCLKIKESLREINADFTYPINRDKIIIVQTPQVFKKEVIKKSYEKSYEDSFTDDASLVQENGYEIKTIDGNQENIKITNPKDLLIAEVFIKNLNNK